MPRTKADRADWNDEESAVIVRAGAEGLTPANVASSFAFPGRTEKQVRDKYNNLRKNIMDMTANRGRNGSR
jgi:hypothetical protein